MQAINARDQYTNYPSSRDHGQVGIIDIAQEIDTFEISIQPFEDCCTIFAPDRPKTILRLRMRSNMKHVWMSKALVERAICGNHDYGNTPQAEKDSVDELIDDLL